MKSTVTILSGIFIVFLLSLVQSCKEDEPKSPPVLTTTAASTITYTTAVSGGNIATDGGATVTARGVCWSINHNPTTSDSKTNEGTGVGFFTSSITGLTAGTSYYVRSYATNSVGTAYGNEVEFKTFDLASPALTTSTVTATTYTTAISGGNITSDGGTTITARGVCWSINHNPTITDSKTNEGTGIGVFTSNLTGLTAGTTYYARSYATNSVGTTYGNELEFKTIAYSLPELTTSTVISVAHTTAISGGNISTDGGATVTARGICWSINHNPTISDSKIIEGTGIGIFTSNMTGLPDGTTLYVRSFATNNVGTAYGNEVEFKTIPISITDGEGNIYHTTIIGTQVWLVENLVATKYRNGDPVPLISENSQWEALSTGAYSSQLNDPANSTIYGHLYNWYTVADIRKIAPAGWHIPSETEWTTLMDYLGGEPNAGGKLKETGLAHWLSPNDGATNETGFTALPGGYRNSNGSFSNPGYLGVWWSTSEQSINDAYALFTYNAGTQLHGEPNDKNLGFSIRCIMDK